MKKEFVPLFLVVILSLILFGCKKDKEDKNPINTEQDIRTSVYSITISGDFEGEYEVSVANVAGGSGAVSGGFDTEINEFGLGIAASELPNNGSWGLGIYAEMSALATGTYALGDVDMGYSSFTFLDDSTSVEFIVDSGSLNITNVEQAHIFAFGLASGHYINGTFSLTMSNDENETATAQGQIVNGYIVSN